MINMISEIYWTIALTIYASIILFATKFTYNLFCSWGQPSNVAIYYNRKILHMLVGGAIAIACPFVFSTPIYPLMIGILMAIATYLPYKTGKILYWVQTEDNMNDVNFCLMAGISVYLLWVLMDDPYLAIIPVIYMAFGDGVTGVARNMVFQKRTKSPIGNVFMALVCIPSGYFLASLASTPIPMWGVISAVVASIVERYEFGFIDDNILITVSATTLIYIGSLIGPII